VSVDEHTIELAGSPVFYRSAPHAGEPVLYLHGIPTSSDDWIPFLERTGGLAPDLPGFGRSGKGGHLEYSPDGYARFLEQLLEVLQIERVKLVLHDWGAAAGLVFAQQRPRTVLRLVVLNGVPLFSGFARHRAARLWRRRGIGELVMGATTRPLLARALRGAAGNAGAWPDWRVKNVWDQFDQGTQRAILRLHRISDNELARAGAGLASLQMPALVLWGERDPWLPVEVGMAYASQLPNCTLGRLPAAGHWPWLDDPGVVERVAEFLVRD